MKNLCVCLSLSASAVENHPTVTMRLDYSYYYRSHSRGMGKVMLSQASVCQHLWGVGGGISLVRTGGTPVQVPGQDGGGGFFHPRWVPLAGWGYPAPSWQSGVPSTSRSQVRAESTTPIGRMGVPSSSRSGPRMGGGCPQPEQHSMYLLHSRRYASCVHTGLYC